MSIEANELLTGHYLIDLLRAVLKNEKPGAIPQGITMEDVYQMAKKHSVDCIAYAGLSKILEKDLAELDKKWKNRSMQCAMQGVIQFAERDKLYRLFSEAGIRILPLKGCLLKEIYPYKEFRQMADLDILVDEENALAAKDIMETAGYNPVGHFGYNNHDEYEKKPWCSVEIHRELFPKRVKNADKYKDVWERAYEEKVGSGIYRLTWDDFYICMLEHFAKHLYGSGSGIRSVMDVHVFLKYKGQELDRKYLKKQLKELELWEFKELAEQLAENWFEKGITGAFNEIEELIITSGSYGTKEQFDRVKIDKLCRKYHSKLLARVVFVGQCVFLRYEKMCLLYPFLKKYAVFMPFCWLHRILLTIVKKRHKIKALFSFVSRVYKETASEK